MPTTATRRITVRGRQGSADTAVPDGMTLADVITRVQALRPGDVVLDERCRQASLTARVATVPEGSVFTIVSPAPAEERKGRRWHGEQESGFAGLWWVVVGTVIAILGLALGQVTPDAINGAVAGVSFLLAAAAAVVLSRNPTDQLAKWAPFLALLIMAAQAAALLVPQTAPSAPALRLMAAALGAALLAALLRLTTSSMALRGAAGAASAILLGIAFMAGLGGLLGWGLSGAAIAIIGVVPLAYRVLPSVVVSLPEGYFVDGKRFMSVRWNVRGPVPEAINSVDAPVIQGRVDAATATVDCGTALLCVVAVAMTPFAFGASRPTIPDICAAVTLVFVVAALWFGPRRSSAPRMRWIPRSSAGLIALIGCLRCAPSWNPDVVVAIASSALAVGVICGLLSKPIAGGLRSLWASRIGDWIESAAIAFALPAALVAAGVWQTIQRLVS